MTVEDRIVSLAKELGIELFSATEANPLEEWIPNSETVRQKIEPDPHSICKQAKCVLLLGCFIDWEYKDIPGYATVSAYYPVSNRLYNATVEFILELRKLGVFAVHGNKIPVKPYAVICGFGKQGRNSLLITQNHGSRIALSAVLVDRTLGFHACLGKHENPYLESCNTCLACVKNCPTNALRQTTPDPERCLRRWMMSGERIPVEYRDHMDNSLLGCDRCQDICPENLRHVIEKKDPPSCLSIDRLLTPDQNEISELGALIGENMARRKRVIGQAAIVAGNVGDTRYIPALQTLAALNNDYIADHAAWAIRKLMKQNGQS